MKIGRAEIFRIGEYEGLGFPPKEHLPDWSDKEAEKHLGWLVPGHYAPEHGRLLGSVHGWLVRVRGTTILIDTCSGHAKERPHTPFFSMLDSPFLDSLLATGVRPEEVDYVLCTHLHVDHVGWNTHSVDGEWLPTFPNARYLVSRTEFKLLSEGELELEDNRKIFEDSIQPLIDADKLLLVDPPSELVEGISIEPAPGHTPGHVMLRIADPAGDLIFVGDLMHHPIQVLYPDWSSNACRDPRQAAETRRRLFADCSGTNATLFPVHFAAPYCCRIGEEADRGYECIFVAPDQ
jgi:glyoxylase-like metal-dependent hydrolase (beta-lactamase superfamily II)